MKIIVAGGGKVGGALCFDLAAENHDVVLIDIDPRVVEHYSSGDIFGIVGNSTNLDIQREAGVPGCDVFLAVTDTDEINIIASIFARKLGAKATLARVRNPEYSRDLEFVQERVGISMMVNPELETARSIAKSIQFPSAIGIETFLDGHVQMVNVRIVKSSTLIGLQLNDFRKMYGTILVCVVQRGADSFIPGGNFTLREGDLLHVTGKAKDLDAIYKAAGCLTKKIRSIMIIGGGRITRYLLKLLSQQGKEICVIDHNETAAEAMAAQYPKAKVIVADGTDQSILIEQHIEHYDCFIALTGIDEENIVTSLFAAKKNVPKIVTKVNRRQLLDIFGDLGLQTIVTPTRLVSNSIVRFVRSMHKTLGSKVEAVYRIGDGNAEALQFEVLNDSPATGVPLKDLKLKKNILIAYIIRNHKQIFPTGNDEIRPGDHVIAVTTHGRFDEIDDMLMGKAK